MEYPRRSLLLWRDYTRPRCAGPLALVRFFCRLARFMFTRTTPPRLVHHHLVGAGDRVVLEAEAVDRGEAIGHRRELRKPRGEDDQIIRTDPFEIAQHALLAQA